MQMILAIYLLTVQYNQTNVLSYSMGLDVKRYFWNLKSAKFCERFALSLQKMVTVQCIQTVLLSYNMGSDVKRCFWNLKSAKFCVRFAFILQKIANLDILTKANDPCNISGDCTVHSDCFIEL